VGKADIGRHDVTDAALPKVSSWPSAARQRVIAISNDAGTFSLSIIELAQ
jgi:hypothetical protein